MRIAVCLAGTDAGRSGIGVYVREALPRLAPRVHEAGGEILALGTHADLQAYEDVLADVERVELPAYLDRPGISALWHLLAVDRSARAAGADVLLLPAANRRCVFRPSLPTVGVVHDLAQLHVPHKYDALRMAYLRHAVLRGLTHADTLVAVSEATRRDIEAAVGPDTPPIEVVPNGVDWQRFAAASSPDDPRIVEARARTGLEGPYVLYPARLEHPGKNHLRLLRAFAESGAADTHVLALAGKDAGGREVIANELARLGLETRVRMLGYVPDELLPGLVAGSDGVVMVGLREGFGLPALEALAAGRPLLASRAGALPEVTGDLAVLCDPSREASLAEGLRRVLHDPAVRERAAREGPAHASAYDWQRTADRLFDACRRVVPPEPPRREPALLPRAPLSDVLRGRAPVVGARLDPDAPRGLFSPVEARIALGLAYEDLAEEERHHLDTRSSLRGDAGIAARALLAQFLSQEPGTSSERSAPAHAEIVSARVDNATVDEALESIFTAPPEPRARIVCFAHAHALNLAAFDPELARCLARSDCVFPDGIGLRTAARMLGIALRHNLNGTDMLPLICREAAASDVPLALVGAPSDVVEQCAANLRGDYPGVRIPVVSHGYLDDVERDTLIARLQKLGRCIVLVGMGTPLQERFAFTYLRDALPEATVVTVGGLFHFFSGAIPRAPVAWRELGLEWVWRMGQEPRRLARRYLVGNPLFLLLAAAQRVSGRPVRRIEVVD